MLHDGAEDRRLQDMPLGVLALADGNGGGFQGHPGDAFYFKQTAGQGDFRDDSGSGKSAFPEGKTASPGTNRMASGSDTGSV